MKRALAFSFILAIGFVSATGILLSSNSFAQTKSDQSGKRLALEITNSSCKSKLYIPANLVEGKGLQATIPVENGEGIKAVRIIPIMEKEKVSFSISFISETQSFNGTEKSETKIATRTAAKGETLIIKDEQKNSPWEIEVKAVSIDDVPISQMLPGCGCARCGGLAACPNDGQCLDTSCGQVCCIGL